MGDSQVSKTLDEDRRRRFTRALLEDVYALEKLLTENMLETGVRRIGAEQEMFLVTPGMRPSAIATEILEDAQDPRLTTELARFNLEANLKPRRFTGDCFRQLHGEIEEVLDLARSQARKRNSEVLLAGILPTLRKEDLGIHNMTPNPRYYALNDEMVGERGADFSSSHPRPR